MGLLSVGSQGGVGIGAGGAEGGHGAGHHGDRQQHCSNHAVGHRVPGRLMEEQGLNPPGNDQRGGKADAPPEIAKRRPCPTTSRTKSLAWAPRAIRTPSSCIRWATL